MMMAYPRLLALLLGSAIALAASASVFEPRRFGSEADALRFKSLTEELRCLVCQNQTIADSDADLARDLRDRVFTMIEEGRSDTEIVSFMVERYGDFVLYRPPWKLSTVLLWVGPFVLAVLGLGLLLAQLRRIRRTTPAHEPALGEDERERARALLSQGTASEGKDGKRRAG